MNARVASIFFLLLLTAALPACGQNSEADLMAEGQRYMQEKNYQGAIVIFKTLLEQSPEKMEARFALGKAYLRTGKLDQAEKSFEKYARQNPYDAELLLETGRLKLFRQDYAGAAETLAAYTEKEPKSAEGFSLLGRADWAQGKDEEAKAMFEKALSLDPNQEEAELALAQMSLAQDDPDRAKSLVDNLLAASPDNREGLYFKAKLAGMQGDQETYRDTMKALVKAHPTDGYAKFLYAKTLLAEGDFDGVTALANELQSGAPKMPFGKMLKGMVSYAQKDYRAAVNAFQEAVAIQPDIEGYFYLGMSYYGMGDLETAISQLRVAADRSDDFLKAREMISLILFQQKRFNESIAEAQKIIEVDSNNVLARVILGDAYTAQGDPDMALGELKEITEKNPNFANAFIKMGALYYEKGEMGESEEALKGAMNAAPDNIRPRLVLSSFYLRNGDKDLAQKVLKDGLKGTPDDVPLYVSLARMSLLDKDSAKAREYLDQARSLDAKNPAPYMMLASIDLAERDTDSALAEYNALLAQREGFVRALLAKAVVLDTLGNAGEAVAAYKEAVKSGDATAYMAYAGSLRKAGDNEGALAVANEGLGHSAHNIRLTQLKADILYGMKRYEEVLEMSNGIEKINREAGLSLRTRTFVLMKEYDKAVAAARQMCDFNPKSPAGYLILADVNMNAGRSDDWGRALSEGVEKCGPDSALLLQLGRYYSSLGDYPKALTYFDSVIKSDGNSFQAHAMQGDVYLTTGRTNKAVDSYSRALELNDRYIPALNNLAMIYVEDPKTAPEALRLAYKAYLLAPWNPSIMDTFGYALAMNGKADTAVSILEKAASVQADDQNINYHLGYAYYKAGDREQAQARLKTVADCAQCEKSRDARELLKAMDGE
ncbi:Photosystem I assembly protein Ycf3 [Pseudodesulfovibrio hydrargyri]|uniref:Photosystem I assembly protein Ycf3 n=1 Tax=Pseudodesulfovibrio hydrargyri TaxID=2125990 RepID=A0A1J5N0I0_9BACT|nr:XrtA/PEP-CTERM system TPR-repeat protein PrsT [Pseudodesulfovibrio hydrargyri]OIQ49155.1 Photosystem I assembly protein Ycf3 [Pseudodesulfovibrio hydrargyri]